MTLIIGIRCTDGVVMGADSAITFTDFQANTIKQIYRQKLSVLCGKNTTAIVGGSGFHGHIQRFENIVNRLMDDGNILIVDAVDIGRQTSKLTRTDFAETLNTEESLKLFPFSALMAIHCKSGDEVRAQLIEFVGMLQQPEVKLKDNWFVSIGSGQKIADPLLGLMRKIYWSNQPPNLQGGIFMAHMVLKLACDLAPGGIAPPVKLATLSQTEEGLPCAREFTEKELQESLSAVENALDYYGRFPDLLRESSSKLPPQLDR